jgi:nicotinamidase-related amidase
MAETKLTYEKEITALVVVDPYNDFISEGGKIWDLIKGVAEANQCVPHMLEVLNAARKAGLRVFYALHHRYRPGDYETWNNDITPSAPPKSPLCKEFMNIVKAL